MAKNIEVTLTLDTKQFDRKMGSAKKSLGGLNATAGRTGGGIMALAGRFAPLAAAVGGAVAAFKGLSASVEAAKKIEDIGVVLNNIVGSAEGGAAALQLVREVAQELPFDLEQIAGATPALATVSKNLGDLEDNIRLAADVAAVSGLSFEDASSQIQRAFAGGAGAADMFREKGVLAMAGFQAGASYSIEETQRKFREFGESIEGAAGDLNQTLGGAASQFQDRMFNFSAAMGAAINPELTAFINELVKVFDDNQETITAFAKTIGEGVVNGFFAFLRGGAMVVDFLYMLGSVFNSIAVAIRDNFGDIIVTVMDYAVKAIGGVIEAVGFLGKQLGRLVSWATGNTMLEDFFTNVQNAANKARTEGIEGVGEALEGLGEAVPTTTATDWVENLITTLQEAGVAADEEARIIAEKIKDGLVSKDEEIKNGLKDTADAVGETVKTLKEDLEGKFGSAVKGLVDGLATSLMEGKDILGNFKDFFKTIVKEMIAQAIRLAVIQPILQSIFGMFGYNIGFTQTGGIESITKRAAGGPVMRNKPYVVGELGPELFVPSQAGQIVNNNEMGMMGGSGTAVTYNINAVDAASFKQLVARDPEFIYRVSRVGQRRQPA
jgi:hypothetical protein